MSYDPTGGEQGPPGATGATGVTGTFDLDVDANSVLFTADGITPTFDSDFTYENNTLSSPNVTISDTLSTHRLSDRNNLLGLNGQVLTSITAYEGQIVSWQTLPTLPTAQGIAGSIQFNDGSGGFTGSSGFLWTETGGIGQNASILTAGSNGNYFNMDAPGSMQIGLGQVDVGNSITISGGSTIISLIDGVPTDNPPIDGSLQVIINAYGGVAGEYLGSDGSGKVTWSIPPTNTGPTGPTGPTGATGPINLGLYNKLQIVPVATPTPSTVVWSSLPTPTAPTITNPNSWVWDSTTASPTSGSGNSWRFSKAVGVTGQAASISWAMFSKVASMGSSVLNPAPSPSIPKNTLEAVYFLIKPTINITNTSTPAVNVLTLNIYSYSATGTPNFYNTRWGYNILTTATTLVAGYTYLLYAFDVAVTSTGANGTIVPPTQTTFLRDPYDIYTNIPHIGMQNVITAGSTTVGYDSVPITAVAINSTTSAVTTGLDFIITKCGYKVGGTNVEYTLNFT